jgi:hypothetical protein
LLEKLRALPNAPGSLTYATFGFELEPERVEDPEDSVELEPRLSAHPPPFLLRHGVAGLRYQFILMHKKLVTRRLFKPRGDRCDEH